MNSQSFSKGFFPEETSDLYWQVLDNNIPLVLVNENGLITYANAAFFNITGLTEKELKTDITALIDQNFHSKGIRSEISNQIKSGKAWKRLLWLRKKDNESHCFKAAFYPWPGQKQPVSHLIIFLPELNDKPSQEDEMAKKPNDFSSWAHDLRNPLNNLSALCSLLLETPLNEQQKDYVRKIIQTTDILSGMIDDISLVCQGGNAEVKPFSKPFELKKTIGEFSQYFLERAGQQGIRTAIEIDDSLPQCVFGDQRRLNQVIIYLAEFLLSLKKTKAIRITSLLEEANDENCEVSFFVLGQFYSSDQTGGPDEENQLSFSQTIEKVRHNIELLNGNILLQEFTPKALYMHFVLNFRLKPDKEKTREPEKQPDPEHKIPENIKILVAEDVELNQLVMKHQLQKIGVDADFVRTGFSVLEKLKTIQYDLIITDVQMPGLDGFQTIEAIRSEKTTPYHDIPIICITASVGGRAMSKCLEAGAEDFVPKPFDPKELKDKIIKHVSSYRQKPKTKMKPNDITPQKVPSEKLFDLKYLEELSEGDQEFSASMISFFVENTPRVLTTLKEKVEARNWEDVRQIAHKLKPQVLYMGISLIAEEVELVEQFAHHRQNLDQIGNKVQYIEKICLLAIEQLKEELKNFRPPEVSS